MVGRVNVAIVGLGQHGSAIASLLAGQGHAIVGAVDVGDKVGKPVSNFVAAVAGDQRVLGAVEDLVPLKPNVAVLAASTDLQQTVSQAETLLRGGINVVTLQPDLLVPDPSWADALDAAGKATGASFLSTGVQDTWWIHLPAIMAGSSVDVTMIEVISYVDADQLPMPVGQIIGIGMTPAQFEPHAPMLAGGPAIMGAPLQQAAKLMGLEVTSGTSVVLPVHADTEVRWVAGDAVIPVGQAIGMTHVTTYETAQGITFKGALTTALQPGGVRPKDRLLVRGTPDLTVEFDQFPGIGVTNASAINRILDVIEASGGVLSAKDLAPMRYRV